MAKCTVVVEVHSILITTSTTLIAGQMGKSKEQMMRLSVNKSETMEGKKAKREKLLNVGILLAKEGQVQHQRRDGKRGSDSIFSQRLEC